MFVLLYYLVSMDFFLVVFEDDLVVKFNVGL